ncbi:MAG: hypothetical protein GX626_04950 [Spirochaetales bacterium]|nr:hypothetical protein [Spirochaetales bacterium]
MKRNKHAIQYKFALLALCTLLLTGCGVYSKVPPVNPDQSEWEGPLLDKADMEHVQIVVKSRDTTIVLSLEDLDADLSLLAAYLSEPENQKAPPAQETGEFVLVIQKYQE